MKFILALFLMTAAAVAQVPDTDIFVATLSQKDGKLHLGEPKNVTNRKGYDNQPHFDNKGGLLYSSIREDQQTDIYRVDLATNQHTRLTQTDESEYSPTVTPDGGGFSVVQVEADGKTQRLHRFNWGETRQSETLLDQIKNVGYHCWINADELALFLLGDAFTLVRAGLKEQKTGLAASDVGRCILRIPGQNKISFVHKRTKDTWWLCSLDLDSGKIKDLVETRPGSEDYVWMKDGGLLMGQDAGLYHWKPKSGWKPVADLKAAGMPAFYRLALNSDNSRLALVAYSGERP